MAKCKFSFRYEFEEEFSEVDIQMIKVNLNNVNLEERIKDLLDVYLLVTNDSHSRILDYRWELKR